MALHNKVQDAWIILNGEVLDVTRWIPLHPGGEQTLVRFLGKDASLEWNMIHAPGTATSCKKLEEFGKILGIVLGYVSVVDQQF